MLYVENMREIDAATWDRLVRESPGGGHALQTYAWGEFKRTQGWRPLRLALRDDADGHRVLGTGQLLIRAMPGTGGAIAYCVKGPWVDWSSGEQARAMLGGMEHFARRHGAYLLKVESELLAGPAAPTAVPPNVDASIKRTLAAVRRLRHANGNGHAAADPAQDGAGDKNGGDKGGSDKGGPDKRVVEARAALQAVRDAGERDGLSPGRAAFAELGFVKSLWDQQFRTTMVIDLDRSPDEMLARMHSKWRYNVKLARRKGVTIEQDDSVAGMERLYDMDLRTAQRNGFMLRPKEYFFGAWRAMIEAGYAHIFFAYHEGRPLAALLAYTFGHKVWYTVGASETEGRNVMPAHALQFHIMEWARERGIDYYDLVAIPNLENIGPDDPLWDIYVFKSGFGGRPVEWAGAMDKILDPRGRAWEALEPAYYRLYKWRTRDVPY